MAETEELLKEFQEVRSRYNDIVNQLLELGVPGLIPIEDVAAKCSVGEVCHGGEFLTAQVTRPATRPK